MNRIISAALLVVAAIHLLPLAGVLGGTRLDALYGIAIDEPNLEILLRHRAVLFGLLGTFLLVAAFRRTVQLAALVAGLASVVSFLWLAASVGNTNPEVARVVTADLVALASLFVALVAFVVRARRT